MANPRKFSEKIALHNQKQAEETAAFEKIMREVSDATNKVNSSSGRAKIKPAPEPEVVQTLVPSQQSLGTFRSGSLPNVAAPQPPATGPEAKPEEASLASPYGPGAGRSGGASPGPRSPGQRGRAASSVGPMRRPADRKHDTSPYGSNVYLSPPPDGSWRRTNSDSALHQSCAGAELPPGAQHLQHHQHLQHLQQHQHLPHQNHRRGAVDADAPGALGASPAARPRSSCEIPRIPNNSAVYESGGGGGGGGDGGGGGLACGELQVPGGSLPDLTSVHYPPHYPPCLPHRAPDYRARYSPASPGGGSASPATGGLSPASGSPVGATVPPAAVLRERALFDAQSHLSVPNANNYLHRNKALCERGWLEAQYGGAGAGASPPSQYSSASNVNVGVPSPAMVHSPGSPGESPQADYSNLHQALLQPFEQITMMDAPAASYGAPYGGPGAPHPHHAADSAHAYAQLSHSGYPGAQYGARRARDPVAGGAYPLQSPQPSAPATPASIPDIILTDYSGELDAGIFGGEEAQLRAGLDLDDLTLLEEPGALLPDSAVEHGFRLDRLDRLDRL